MLKIRIETKNQAFVDDFDEELKHCLDDVKVMIYKNLRECSIHDTNGNNVGSFKLTNN